MFFTFTGFYQQSGAIGFPSSLTETMAFLFCPFRTDKEEKAEICD
jgi:cellobiose phosphorylase